MIFFTQNSGMMYRPHYVSLPEAASAASSALEDTTKAEDDASLANATKESTGQAPAIANTSIATSSAAPASTTGVGGAMGVASQQPISSSNMNQPQVSGAIRPPPSSTMPSQAAQQGQFTLNPGVPRPGMSHMMMGAGRGVMGRGMMGAAGGGAAGMAPMNRIMVQQPSGGMSTMAARLRLEQIRAQIFNSSSKSEPGEASILQGQGQ